MGLGELEVFLKEAADPGECEAPVVVAAARYAFNRLVTATVPQAVLGRRATACKRGALYERETEKKKKS